MVGAVRKGNAVVGLQDIPMAIFDEIVRGLLEFSMHRSDVVLGPKSGMGLVGPSQGGVVEVWWRYSEAGGRYWGLTELW